MRLFNIIAHFWYAYLWKLLAFYRCVPLFIHDLCYHRCHGHMNVQFNDLGLSEDWQTQQVLVSCTSSRFVNCMYTYIQLACVFLSAHSLTGTEWLHNSFQLGWLHVDFVFVKLEILLEVYMYIYILSQCTLLHGKAVYYATISWQFKNNLHFLLFVFVNIS